MFNLFQKCPKCGSKNLTEVKEAWWKALARLPLYLAFFITIFFVKAPKPLMVCKDCGFSWEKR